MDEPDSADAEHRAAAHGRLQHALARILDATALDERSTTPTWHERWSDVRLIRGLRDDSMSHDRFWSMGPAAGGGPSTHGHNDVRDVILDFPRLADATAEPEVLGLIARASGARPAGILTSALVVDVDTALDVRSASPDAAHVGPDCTESMRKRRADKYGSFCHDLAAARVRYRPLIWSCSGYEHPDTSAALHALARRIARRRGLADHRSVLARIRRAVGVALARRGAQMAHACLLRPGSCGLGVVVW